MDLWHVVDCNNGQGAIITFDDEDAANAYAARKGAGWRVVKGWLRDR